MRTRLVAVTGIAALVSIGAVEAADRWETTLFNITDDNAGTHNVLRHGVPQVGHDLEGFLGSPDEDWMIVRAKAGHSYEARVSGAGMYWDPACGASAPCPRFDRVDAMGTILTAGVVTSDDTGGFDLGPGQALVASGMAVRWISTVDGKELVRARGDQHADLPAGLAYDVEFYDTTFFAPRFNNSATQVTVLIIQNTTNATVTGNIDFYGPTGTLLHTQPLSVPQHGTQVFNSSTIVALQGQSGSVTITHTGGYGCLAGKAVAVEPATGFTFDTALQPIPR